MTCFLIFCTLMPWLLHSQTIPISSSLQKAQCNFAFIPPPSGSGMTPIGGCTTYPSALRPSPGSESVKPSCGSGNLAIPELQIFQSGTPNQSENMCIGANTVATPTQISGAMLQCQHPIPCPGWQSTFLCSSDNFKSTFYVIEKICIPVWGGSVANSGGIIARCLPSGDLSLGIFVSDTNCSGAASQTQTVRKTGLCASTVTIGNISYNFEGNSCPPPAPVKMAVNQGLAIFRYVNYATIGVVAVGMLIWICLVGKYAQDDSFSFFAMLGFEVEVLAKVSDLFWVLSLLIAGLMIWVVGLGAFFMCLGSVISVFTMLTFEIGWKNNASLKTTTKQYLDNHFCLLTALAAISSTHATVAIANVNAVGRDSFYKMNLHSRFIVELVIGKCTLVSFIFSKLSMSGMKMALLAILDAGDLSLITQFSLAISIISLLSTASKMLFTYCLQGKNYLNVQETHIEVDLKSSQILNGFTKYAGRRSKLMNALMKEMGRRDDIEVFLSQSDSRLVLTAIRRGLDKMPKETFEDLNWMAVVKNGLVDRNSGEDPADMDVSIGAVREIRE